MLQYIHIRNTVTCGYSNAGLDSGEALHLSQRARWGHHLIPLDISFIPIYPSTPTMFTCFLTKFSNMLHRHDINANDLAIMCGDSKLLVGGL